MSSVRSAQPSSLTRRARAGHGARPSTTPPRSTSGSEAYSTHHQPFPRSPEGLIFAGPDNGALRNTNFHRRVWAKALQDAGVPKIHFHDLRHTGNTLAASTGASTRELMTRMGHSSTRAALIYQHSTDERQREVARRLDALARGALTKKPSGT
ncbi:hypothetical protein EJK15_07285 [Nonomuraea basaltis]|nr:hypothetical protein EJK15_07285 [Nonomuraea basaltis]